MHKDLKTGERWTAGATPEGVAAVARISGGVSSAADLAPTEFLRGTLSGLAQRASNDPAELGGVYYITKAGEEGFIWGGKGTEHGTNSPDWALPHVPDDAAVVFTVHTHPNGPEFSGAMGDMTKLATLAANEPVFTGIITVGRLGSGDPGAGAYLIAALTTAGQADKQAASGAISRAEQASDPSTERQNAVAALQ